MVRSEGDWRTDGSIKRGLEGVERVERRIWVGHDGLK